MARNKRDLDELMPQVQSELRRVVEKHLQRQRRDYTLQPTAIVNEVYIRFAEKEDLDWKSRTHFFAMAAKAARWVFLDQVRKRHPGRLRTTFLSGPDDESEEKTRQQVQLLALGEALRKLEKLKERQAKIVELRYFSGMKVQEVADYLGVAKNTVEKDWTMARAWLGVELKKALED